MDAILEKLKEYGADVDGSMARFLDDIDLYKTCFTVLLSDESFSKLGAALKMKDYATAFECAHTLKGITGNMGLTPLYKDVCSIVESLREGEYSGLEESYERTMKQVEVLKQL